MRDALTHRADKQAWVDWLFGRVAPHYDLANQILSAGTHRRLKRRLLDMADIEPDQRILDIGCGTGDLTWMAAERASGGWVVGSDISAAMLALAEAKRPPGPSRVHLVLADAGALPFRAGSFDRVTCGFAGRNFPDWTVVLGEVSRVLAPGGRFCNLDFARPPNRLWDGLYRGTLSIAGAVLGTLLHRDPRTYVYIARSLAHYPGQRWLDAQMRDVGFETELVEPFGCLVAYNLARKPP